MTIALVTVETMHHELAARALANTAKCLDFDEILIFSDKNFMPNSRWVPVEHFSSVRSYCDFMLKGMVEHVQTDHILFVQWDAQAHDSGAWSPEFLEYDYIGAPWPWANPNMDVGNGGFSLRSRRLLEALKNPNICTTAATPNEDQVIGDTFRPLLETLHGIKYAPTDVAARFSYELGNYSGSFGCHGPWNIVRFSDDDTVDFYLQNMDYATWNMYKWHHVLFELARKRAMRQFGLVVDRMTEHSPQSVSPVLQSLSVADFSKDIF